MTRTVGMVGLGSLGFAMASNLMAAGHRVVGYRRSAMDAFVAAGGVASASPADVARRGEVVITALPDGAALEEVYLGPRGILAGARAGLVAVDLSTVPLPAKRRVKDAADKAGIALLDGTVSGNPHYMAARNAAIFIGGDRTAFDAVAPLLRDITDKVTWLGPFGAGRVAKFVALYLVCVHTLAAAEAFELATRAGLDRAAMFEAIAGSNATSVMLESRGALMVDREYSSYSQDKGGAAGGEGGGEGADAGGAKPLRGMASRLRQVERLVELAHGLGGRYPLMEAMNGAYGAAIAAGIGRFDIAEVFEYLMADDGTAPAADIDRILGLLERLS